MKYYLSPEGECYAYAEDGSDDSLIPATFTLATLAQAQAIQNPPQTLAQLVVQYTGAVQAHLDSFAQTWRYESILSAASYATSTVPAFQAEAQALIAWRDQVWNSCYTTLASVEAGTAPMPASTEALVATLPATPTRPA